MPPKDKMQQSIARLKTALKQGQAIEKKLQEVKKQLQDLGKQSKRLLKK